MIFYKLSSSDTESSKRFLVSSFTKLLSSITLTRNCKNNLDSSISILSDRFYIKDALVGNYLEILSNIIQFNIKGKYVTIELNNKNKYYRLVKSIELGSYKIKRVPLVRYIVRCLINSYNLYYSSYKLLGDKVLKRKIHYVVNY